MNRQALTLVIILMFACRSATALEVGKIDIPDSLDLPNDGGTLVLNGAGIREKLFIDIYVGALYLPERTSDSLAILGDSRPASVAMHIRYSEISREKIIDGWEDGLAANLDSDAMQAIRPRLDQFNLLFTPVSKGDVIRIDYVPGNGTEVRINGEWRGVIEGNDFFRALLKVWLGARPVSKSLKNDMLGTD